MREVERERYIGRERERERVLGEVSGEAIEVGWVLHRALKVLQLLVFINRTSSSLLLADAVTQNNQSGTHARQIQPRCCSNVPRPLGDLLVPPRDCKLQTRQGVRIPKNPLKKDPRKVLLNRTWLLTFTAVPFQAEGGHVRHLTGHRVTFVQFPATNQIGHRRVLLCSPW